MAKQRRLIVDLGDADLDDKVVRRIGDGIQRVVLDALAEQRDGPRQTYGIKFPIEWIGILIDKTGPLRQLDELEKEIAKTLPR